MSGRAWENQEKRRGGRYSTVPGQYGGRKLELKPPHVYTIEKCYIGFCTQRRTEMESKKNGGRNFDNTIKDWVGKGEKRNDDNEWVLCVKP
jgi:hypothetical protein